MYTFIEHSSDLKKSKANVYRVCLITEGQGSSGFYPAEVLKRDIPVALPKGTHVYANHMSKEQRDNGGVRDIDEFVGSFQVEPFWVEEESAVYADIKFRKDVAEFIEEFKDDIGVSIEIHKGRKNEEGIVEEMGYTPINSLAIVPKAGARGKIVELIENFRYTESNQVENSAEEDKNRIKMEEILEAISKDRSQILEAINALAEALKPSDEGEETPAVDIAAVAEAVATSGLTEHGRKSVYSQVNDGVAVEQAIEAEKAREEAIRESLKVQVVESGGFKSQEASDWTSKANELFGGK